MSKNQTFPDQLLALSTQERAEIAQILLSSLDAKENAADCTELWVKESEARPAAAKHGETSEYPR